MPVDTSRPSKGRCAHLRLGEEGENAAAAFLTEKGCKILARNWRYGHLELDIVCEDAETIVFVEVKTRKSRLHGGPAGAITDNKKLRVAKAAAAWLSAHDSWNRQCRFDIICIVANSGNSGLEHYCNAFDLSQIMDSGYAHRKLW